MPGNTSPGAILVIEHTYLIQDNRQSPLLEGGIDEKNQTNNILTKS